MEKGTLFQFRGSQTQYQNHDRDSSDDQETADLFLYQKQTKTTSWVWILKWDICRDVFITDSEGSQVKGVEGGGVQIWFTGKQSK